MKNLLPITCPKCGYMIYGRLWRCPGCGGNDNKDKPEKTREPRQGFRRRRIAALRR